MDTSKDQKNAAVFKRMTMREMIAFNQEVVGIKNIDLADKLGYDNANVVSMLKAGTMSLPTNKISALASALRLDPLHVALCVSEESQYMLAGLLEAISKRTAVTLNEEKLILAMREASAGRDVNFYNHPALLEKLMIIHSEIVMNDVEPVERTLDDMRKKPRAAIAKSHPALADKPRVDSGEGK